MYNYVYHTRYPKDWYAYVNIHSYIRTSIIIGLCLAIEVFLGKLPATLWVWMIIA